MRILITGATGFVGSRLCERLSTSGHELIVLSRSGGADMARRTRAHAVHRWDPLAAPPPPEALREIDAVVHLAGEPVAGRWTATKQRLIHDTRVLGTRHLVDALAAASPRPRVFVCASAIGYYGNRGDEELREDSAPGDDFLATVCRAWEDEAARATQFDLRTVSLRIAVVLDRGGGALEQMLPPARLGLGGPLGTGRQWWSWIHRDDLVAMLVWALENETAHGAYNASAPTPLRQADFARTLGRVLARPAFLPAPSFALRVLLGGFSVELLSSKRVLPHRTGSDGFRFEYPTLEDALRTILD